MAFEYTKQPWEQEIIGVDFSRRVPAGKTIEAVAVGVTYVAVEQTISPPNVDANSYSPHLFISNVALTGPGVDASKYKILTALISDGIADFQYRVTFRITLSDGQKKEDDVLIIIKET